MAYKNVLIQFFLSMKSQSLYLLVSIILAVTPFAEAALDTIVRLKWPDAEQILKAAMSGEPYINRMSRNTEGTVLYVNCNVGTTNHYTVLITISNITVLKTAPSARLDGETLHNWFNRETRDWMFASGERLPEVRYPMVVSSPDCKSMCVQEKDVGWQFWRGADREVRVNVPGISRIELVDGAESVWYIVGFIRSGPKVTGRWIRLQGDSASDYRLVTKDIPWASLANDLDGHTGDAIFAERTMFFPSCYVYNPMTERKTKIGPATDIVLFVDHRLAGKMSELNRNVVVHSRR